MKGGQWVTITLILLAGIGLALAVELSDELAEVIFEAINK